MAGCKKVRQGLKCHCNVFKKHKHAEITNYMGLIAYYLMHRSIKTSGKRYISLSALLWFTYKRHMFGFVCVCLPNLLPGGRNVKRGVTFAMIDLESTKRIPTRAITRWVP